MEYDTAKSKLGTSNKRRARAVGLAAFALFAAMFARLYSLEVLQAPLFEIQATQNQVRTVTVAPSRGLILDRNGSVLVGNKVEEVLSLSARQAFLHPSVIGRLSKLLGIPASQIKASLSSSQYSPYQPTPIQLGISKVTAIYVQEHQGEFPGVSTQLTTERVYPNGSLAAHVLGYLGPISPAQLKQLQPKGYVAENLIGQSGVEQSYESYLRGTPGVQRLEVNASGAVVGSLGGTRSRPGGNVQLTLDVNLQQEVETQLNAQIKKLSHTLDPFTHLYLPQLTGAAVVEDVTNGSVLAMASNPSYNPALWTFGHISYANYDSLIAPSSNYPLLNRAIAGQYTPGSTFKLATASAALKDGLISPYSYINDTGTFTIPNCIGVNCSYHNSGHESLGNISIQTAITASDDIFFYTLGDRFYQASSQFGPTPIQDMAKAYGWGLPTGINLPGEAGGQVDAPALRKFLHDQNPAAYPYQSWYTADQIEMSFGQGETLITPLQMANAYATFANGGTRYVPRIADGIVNDQGRLVKSFPPVVADHVTLSPAEHQTMLAGFQGVISNRIGTAYGAFLGFPDAQFPLAGKTGTASVQGQAPNAWFVGFGPLPNPKYVVAVVIKQGGFGAVAAAPVVEKIFEYLMAHPIGPAKYGVQHFSAGSTQAISSSTTSTSTPATTTGNG